MAEAVQFSANASLEDARFPQIELRRAALSSSLLIVFCTFPLLDVTHLLSEQSKRICFKFGSLRFVLFKTIL